MLTKSVRLGRFVSKLIDTPGAGRTVQDKIMTTSQWPVPYYNRVEKAYPVRGCLNRRQIRHFRSHRR